MVKDNAQRFVIYRSLTHPDQFELQLGFDGVMKRWKVIKGMPIDHLTRRIAVEQPQEASVGRKSTGRAAVFTRNAEPIYTWDAGDWRQLGHSDGYSAGHLRFALYGQLLRGRWALVRMSDSGGIVHAPWLLVLISPPNTPQ